MKNKIIEITKIETNKKFSIKFKVSFIFFEL